MVLAVLRFTPYFEGTRFAIRTVHDALKWMLNLSEPPGRLAQSRLRLSELNFIVVHRACVKRNSDAFSKRGTNGKETTHLVDGLYVCSVENVQASYKRP